MRTLLVWLGLILLSVILWGVIVYLAMLATMYYFLDPFMMIIAIAMAVAG
jgi:uncharacterized membrane protein (GlpM family)